MKKKKSSSSKSKIRSFIESKGFYIALFSMILLVGFSIYARKLQLENQQNDLSFDDAAWQTALEESGVEFKGNISTTDTQTKAEEINSSTSDTQESTFSSPTDFLTSTIPDEGTAPSVEASASVLPQTSPENMQMPCNGAIIEECSLDDLVYCSTMDDWRTHNGIDIAAAEGEPVKAAAAGTVSQVYDDELLGIVVTIDHGNGITSLYGNLQSYDFIRAGTTVQAGDIIGGVGNPGALESDKEPHVHFEVYKSGEIQNPSDFIVS